MEATLPRGEDQGLWRQAAQLCLLLVEGSGPSKLSFLVCQIDTVTPTLPRSCGDQMRLWGTAAGTYIGWRGTGAGCGSLGIADRGQGDSEASVIVFDQHAESKGYSGTQQMLTAAVIVLFRLSAVEAF